jgi:beta-alanine--pyruvate transaminase
MGGVSLAGMVRNRETFGLTLPNISLIRHTWQEDQRFAKGQPKTGAELAMDLERIAENLGGSTWLRSLSSLLPGSTGTLVPPVGYLEKIREICDKHGLLLVFDEVITGFGRMGTPFATQKFNVRPDIITMAKAADQWIDSNGRRCRDLMKFMTPSPMLRPKMPLNSFHGYTYSAHPAACAAGIATQKIYESEGIFERSAALENYFLDAIWTLQDHRLLPISAVLA